MAMPFSSTFPFPQPPGSPFLLPFLLASSWTWFALSLATIATLLRALPVFNLACFRLRRSPQTCGLPSSPAALPSSADCLLASSSSCLIDLQIDLSSPLAVERTPTFSKGLLLSGRKSVARRRSRINSTSALQKLLLRRQKLEGFMRFSMGVLSCLPDTDVAFTLEEFPNSNSRLKTFNEDFIPRLDSVDKKASAGQRCKVLLESQKQGKNLLKPSQEGREGSICDGLMDPSSKPCVRSESRCIEEDGSGYEKFPPWAFSLLKSVQSVESPAFSPSKVCCFERISSFEKQFGWDQMFCARVGTSWQCAEQTVEVSAEPWQGRHGREVVKLWSVQQRTLLKKLKIVESTVSSLEVGWRNRSVCIGTEMGEISLWDFEKRICVSTIRPLQKRVSSHFMDSANEKTLVGATGEGDMVLGLWDHRSFYEPIFHWERIATTQVSIEGLKCRGHELCVAGAGVLSMHDLRKPNREPIAVLAADLARELKAAAAPAMAREEDPTSLWETEASLASEEDEEYWDDCGYVEMPQAAHSEQSRSGSFMSRCVGLIRSLSPQPSRLQ